MVRGTSTFIATAVWATPVSRNLDGTQTYHLSTRDPSGHLYFCDWSGVTLQLPWTRPPRPPGNNNGWFGKARVFSSHDKWKTITVLRSVFQTEAERRRREAGVQQAKENGLRVMFVCMFFKDISRSRALCEYKLVSCCSPVNSTLHRHDIIRVRFLTSTHHVKNRWKMAFLKVPSRKCMWILPAAYFQFGRQA